MKNIKLKGEPISLAYYSRHNLPQFNTGETTVANRINRNFYRNLRVRGRTHDNIIRMIQPERREQFLKDIQFIAEYLDIKPVPPSRLSLWKKIVGIFKL